MIHFSDMDVARIRKVFETQKGIIEFANWAATVLAEAGIASYKALGHSPSYACQQWSEVILKEAVRIVEQRREEWESPKLKQLRAGLKALADDRNPDR